MKRERIIELWLAGFVLVAGLIVVVVLLGTAAADGPPMSERAPLSFSPIQNLLPTNNVYAFGHICVVGNIIKRNKADPHCNGKDGCYPYGDGCEERDYYCAGNGTGCNYTSSNRHTDGLVDTGNTRWVDVNKCEEKEQKEQEYRDYKCSAGSCNYSINDTKWIDTGIYNSTCNGVSLAPLEITSFSPLSYVDDTVGNWRIFNVTANQAANVSWYLNDTLVLTNESVRKAKCTLLADVVGVHNVTAIASNANGSDMQMWIWNVTELQKECKSTDTRCGSYPNCGNCNEQDGCYQYGDGCEERDYYCAGNGTGCNYTSSNRHTDGLVDTGNTRWVDVNKCEEKEQKEQEYRDYKCSAGCCHYSINDTKWIDAGNTSIKANGTICGCTADNTVKRCYDGNCTDTGICNSTNCSADVACDGKKPDLIIEERYEKGKAGSYTVFFVVKNIGTATAPKGHYATLYVDGVEIEKKLVSTDLEQGETYKGSFKTKVELTGEFDNIKVCADNYNNVDELDEANNCQENQWQPVEKQPTDKPPTDKLPTEKPDLVIEEKYEKGKADRYPVFFVKPVLAQEGYTITIGEDWNVTFTECNYHNSWFEDDPNNPEPWPDQREARSDGNIAYVSLSATPGHAGVARSRVGVDFEWDLGPYAWEEVKNWPVNVTIDFSYHIEAYWATGNGSANAGVSVDGFLGPCFEDGYDLIGYETGHSGSRGDTVSETYQTTVEGLEDLGRRIALQACCQAHSVAEGTTTHHSSAEVQISSIKIEFPELPPIANFTYSPENPVVGEEITFDASNSTDSDGTIEQYDWNFGDENGTEGEAVTHAYSKVGNYTVTLTVTDNDGLQNSTEQCIEVKPIPVLLVYGWHGSSANWDLMKRWLEEDGYTVEILKYDMTQHAAIAAGALSQKIKDINVSKVDIIAHSFGGLVSRHYIESEMDGAENVRNLIMLGTPNNGSQLADYLVDGAGKDPNLLEIAFEIARFLRVDKDWGSTKDMRVENNPYLKELNQNFDLGATKYYVAIGTKPLDIPVLGPISSHKEFLPGPDEGAVTVKSARLPGVPLYCTEDTHSTITKSRRVYTNILRPILSGQQPTPIGPCPTEDPNDNQPIPFILERIHVGLREGECYKSSLSVGSNSVMLCIYFRVEFCNFDFRLISPSGDVIDPDVAASDPNISYVANETAGDDHYWYYIINNPEPGLWQYTITAIEVPEEGVDVEIFGIINNATPPEITSFAPPSPVNDTVCNWRTFNVTVNQPVNVSWYQNGSLKQTNESVQAASCTLHASVSGEHNVTAVAQNANGSDSQTWIWNVRVSNCTCGDICVNTTGWWRDGGAFHPSDTPIQGAIDNATAGDTICVTDGTYTENVDVNKRLTIQSEHGADYTTVQAASSSDHVFAVTADYVTISGFTVKGAGDSHGISIKNSHYCEVHDNIVSFNDDRGIVFDDGGDNYAYNNIVHNNSAYGAIEAIHSDNNTIYNNTAYYNCWGIATNGGSNNLIHNNTIYENDHGVYLDWPSTGNIVSNNNISSNGQGIFTNHNSTDNIITGNSVFSNFWIGIHISTSNNIINSNTVTSNGDGIRLSSASNNLITNNDVSNNSNGICLLESSDDNTVLNNIANSNTWSGIWIFGSSYNNITENTANLNNGTGITLEAISKHNIISKNTANSNNHNGILVRANSGHESATHPWGPSDNNIISGNSVDSNIHSGIFLWEGSSNNTLLGNNVNSNKAGIYFLTSCNNTLKNNVMNNNRYNFGIWTLFNDISHFYHDIDTSNMVDGKPIYYWIAQENQQVPDDAGFVGIVNSTNITVRDLRLTNNYVGVSVVFSNDSRIEDVYVSNNKAGIALYRSCNNILTGINASSNYGGIRLENSNSNLIYNNYFENTFINADDDGNNIWNISKTAGTNIIGGSWLGGNYWSDYAGEDTNGDGLGDTLLPYNSGGEITTGGDWHPLVQAGIAPPEITSFAPPSPVNDTVCNWRTFNVTVKQRVNVSWYLNGTLQAANVSVTEANCTLHAKIVGEHNVSIVATNANGTDMQTWIWNVSKAVGNPDLIITEKWLRWPDNCTICYNVTNIGTGTAPACHNTTLYVDSVEVAHDHVPVDLAPGESYTGCFDGYEWTYTPPSDNITVCADNNETLDELDEDNNCLTNIWMCGDVTGDGRVRTSDGRRIFRHLTFGVPIDNMWAADVTGDGRVRTSDGRRIFRHLTFGDPLNCNCSG